MPARVLRYGAAASVAAKLKMRMIQTVIKPIMITYAFPVAPYRAMDIKRLDNKIA